MKRLVAAMRDDLPPASHAALKRSQVAAAAQRIRFLVLRRDFNPTVGLNLRSQSAATSKNLPPPEQRRHRASSTVLQCPMPRKRTP